MQGVKCTKNNCHGKNNKTDYNNNSSTSNNRNSNTRNKNNGGSNSRNKKSNHGLLGLKVENLSQVAVLLKEDHPSMSRVARSLSA